jgi:hypothetical protein
MPKQVKTISGGVVPKENYPLLSIVWLTQGIIKDGNESKPRKRRD